MTEEKRMRPLWWEPMWKLRLRFLGGVLLFLIMVAAISTYAAIWGGGG